MEVKFVDLKAQYNGIKYEIDSAIQQCIANSDFIGGNQVKEFEKNFAEFCDVKYCISCANGTDALEIALRTLNIQQDDEIILPALSFIATSEAVTNTGGKVIFCDVNPKTYLIDIIQLQQLITPKTKGIIPVHLYGQMAQMDEINEIAKTHNLFIIEDAAQAHGALYYNKKAGQYGDISIFSFFPGKNLGAYGDGGAIVTNNKEFYSKAKKYSNHGRISKYDHEFEGRNSRLDAIQAAILNVKLKYLDEWNDKRRKNAEIYTKLLTNCPQIELPQEHEFSKSVYHLYVIKVRDNDRDKLMDYLKENNIQTGIHYPKILPLLQAYKHLSYSESDFPNAYSVTKKIISLPMFPELTLEQIEYVCNHIKKYYHKKS